MKKIHSLVDNRPVFLGRDGKPLVNGKVFLYDIGTTNPKEAYSDVEYTTPIEDNPLLLDATGRPEVQVFLGYGQYTAHAYKFNGVDPITADPSEWELDNQFDLEGDTADVVSTDLHTVDTIADLRDVDQSLYSVVRVMGYNAFGDMFPRIYFLKTNADSDNGGTIIKNAGISSTSWMTSFGDEIISCELFGMISGSTTQFNSILQKAVTYCTNNGKTLYIPKGSYYVTGGSITFTCKVSIDDGAYFRVVTGLFYLYFENEFDIRLTHWINHPASTGTAVPVFNVESTGIVSPRWFGCKLNGSDDDFSALLGMVSQIKSRSIEIEFDGVAIVDNATSDLEFKNNLIFSNDSGIHNAQTTYDIIFNNIEFKNSCNGGVRSVSFPYTFLNKYDFSAATFANIFFKNCKEVRASFFGGFTAGTTLDLLSPVTACKRTDGTPFVFDMPVSLFSNGCDLSDTEGWNFKYESGTIQVSTALPLRLNDFEAPVTRGVFSGANTRVVIANGETHYNWFLDATPTEASRATAFYRATYCALFGNGELNLDGNRSGADPTPFISNRSNYIDNIISSTSAKGISIYNGAVACSTFDSHVLDLKGIDFGRIKFEDVVGVSSAASIGMARLDECTCLTFSAERCYTFSPVVSGSAAFDFNYCVFYNEFALNNNSFVNYTLFKYPQNSTFTPMQIEGNRLQCVVPLKALKGMSFIGNEVVGLNLVIADSVSGIISGKIVGNKAYAQVQFKANQTATIVDGLICTDNGFHNIEFQNGSGTYNTWDTHTMLVKDNRNELGIAKCSEGWGQISVLNSSIPSLTVGASASVDAAVPAEMITLPVGIGVTRCTGSLYSTGAAGHKTAEFYTIIGITAPLYVGATPFLVLRLRLDYTNTEAAGSLLYADIYFSSFRRIIP